MKRIRLVALFVMVGLVASVAVEAAQRVRERSTQLSHAFVNDTGQEVFGLVVKLSHDAAAVRGDDHKVGPFRNYSGNDTTKVYLSNSTRPIDAGEVVELSFRSYERAARITKYWWTDLRGKRIGTKKKV